MSQTKKPSLRLLRRGRWVLGVVLATSAIAMAFRREDPSRTRTTIVLDSESFGEVLYGRFRERNAYLAHGKSTRAALEGGASAYRFSPMIPRRGSYRLFVWWPSLRSGNARAAYTVHHLGGVFTQVHDQSLFGGQWVSLGVFQFDALVPAIVDVSNLDGTEASVDAIRFVYEGPEPPILRVETTAVPLAILDEPYSADLEAAGGTPPYRWYAYGDLPRGISTGGSRLQGTPEEEGSFDFRLQVEDKNGDLAAFDLTLVVLEGRSSFLDVSTDLDSTPLSSSSAELGDLLAVVEGMGEGDWTRVNENFFSEVWTPAELRPLKGAATNPTPHKIIAAWSSFAWDTRRGDLIIYGGGHANYPGNDVYRWRGSTRRWERASLPSQITQDDLGTWMAIDGVDAAPASAHTYDNNVYLGVSDRFLTYGGAAYDNGSSYFRQISASENRRTGPYLFDPAKADGNKVGGTTGSHVQRVASFPEIVGGEMWENRDIYGKIPGNPPLPKSFVVGATGYSEQGGKDVVYVSARSGGTAQALYKHTIHDIGDPRLDTWEQVGSFVSGFSNQGSGAYDPVLNVFVRTGGGVFTYWDLTTPGANNRNVIFSPEDPTGGFVLDRYFGLDYDPVRQRFALWRGGGRVWMLEPPPTVSPAGWRIEEQPAPTSEVPSGDVGVGILGKWKYIPNLDVFLGLQNSIDGNIWLYKPVGWQRPDLNQPPLVSISSPLQGAAFLAGDDFTIVAVADDSDGGVVRVEFYRSGVKLGEAASSPYSFTWTNVPAGSHELTVVAYDDDDASAESAGVEVSVYSGTFPPAVSITAPADGAQFGEGQEITIEVEASDADGEVVRVEFLAGGVNLGEDSSAPYTFVWAGAAPGFHHLTAVAFDDAGAWSPSSPVRIEILSGGEQTLLLQDGIDGYSGTRDTYLSSGTPSASFGSSTSLLDRLDRQRILVSFDIFLSEGGPIPDGAVIHSARVGLYKFSAYDHLYRLHRLLRPWSEQSANWMESEAGVPWTDAGGSADIDSAWDAEAAVGWDPQWMELDVTVAVQQMSAGQPNFGWMIVPIAGNPNSKRFRSSEEGQEPSRRPKITIVYSPAGDLPPSVSLVRPADGASFFPGEDIDLQAEASDVDGTISRVEFFAGVTKLGEDDVSPYSLLWVGAPEGNHSLTAVAFDDNQAFMTSAPVQISVSDSNRPPAVSITEPGEGAVLSAGAAVTIEAAASDVDGEIVLVEFFEGGVKLGEDSLAPFGFTWASVPSGSFTLTVAAVDDDGATTVSPPVHGIATNAGEVEVVLQDGLNGYAGTRDTYLSSSSPTTRYGGSADLRDDTSKLNSLVRFAVFQSEGGPIPDSATIRSSRLSLYKYSAYDHQYRLHRLARPWSELSANWDSAGDAVSWAQPGAAGVGSDVLADPDSQGAIGWGAGWLDFDVTTAVQELGVGAPNFGWRIVPVAGNGNQKRFYSRESIQGGSLRPKLTIVYALE